MMTTIATIVRMDSADIVRSPPAKRYGPLPLRMLGNTLGFAPQIRRAIFWRKYETPIAVIRTANEPVPLSGLYASLSITIPKTVHAPIATKSAIHPFIPTYIDIMNETYPPTMMTSPCAKFSILDIPYTMVYPSAMIAYTLPRLRPEIKLFNKFITISLYFQCLNLLYVALGCHIQDVTPLCRQLYSLSQ